MSASQGLHLTLPSDPTYFCGVRELVAQILRRLGFSETQAAQSALAVDEALTNIMRHGYDRRIDAPIWLSLTPFDDDRGGGVRIVIEDEARQVDPCNIKGRDLDDIRPGGLGVHIIREVMDEATYERRGPVGMRLTLIKRRAGKPSKAGADDASA